MKTVSVCKAQPITNNLPIGGVIIEVTKELVIDDISLNELEDIFDSDARQIFNALRSNLPQGTRHSLSKLLLNDTANYYVGV